MPHRIVRESDSSTGKHARKASSKSLRIPRPKYDSDAPELQTRYLSSKNAWTNSLI